MSKDLYKILGIPQTATDKDIRAAYRTLAKKYHPDTGAGSSEDRFREIQDAYETLGSPARRADYDRKSVLSEYPTNQRAPSPRFSFWQRQFPGNPSHLDLRGLSSRPKAESIGRFPKPAAGRGFAPVEPLDECDEVILRFLEFLHW